MYFTSRANDSASLDILRNSEAIKNVNLCIVLENSLSSL